MKRFVILAAMVALFMPGDSVLAQQRGNKGSGNQGQQQQPDRGQKQGGGQRGGGEGGGGLFSLLDIDRDGNLSAKEIDGAVAALLKLDSNKDGILDTQELAVRGGGGQGGKGGRGGQQGAETSQRRGGGQGKGGQGNRSANGNGKSE
ncbi:MAG: hypothetical protein KDB00_08990 [Planctomycetales bacterium]|nr:hypothetical protein [Planctomycetales bacterium]